MTSKARLKKRLAKMEKKRMDAETRAAEASQLELGRHEKGRHVARRYAHYWIGDADWADKIIEAYEDPDKVSAELDEEIGTIEPGVPNRG